VQKAIFLIGLSVTGFWARVVRNSYMVREAAGDNRVPGQLTHVAAGQLPHLQQTAVRQAAAYNLAVGSGTAFTSSTNRNVI
jgi:hypothetical protein